MAHTATIYSPKHTSRSEMLPVRGLQYHVRRWGNPDTQPILMLHGWMDVGASFQFLADALLDIDPTLNLIAPDWRGYGQTQWPACDSYFFADYLGDLDALIRHFAPSTDAAAPFGGKVKLIGHSMGGNVSLLYSGAMAARIAAVVNLDGVGLGDSDPASAPKRYARWLADLQMGNPFRTYANVGEVALRLQKNNPRLPADRAAFLAPHWAKNTLSDTSSAGEAEKWEIQGDPAHRMATPTLYRLAETLACWGAITAPVLWVEPFHADGMSDTRKHCRVPPSHEDTRLDVFQNLRREWVKNASHMLHHEHPEEIAGMIMDFWQPM